MRIGVVFWVNLCGGISCEGVEEIKWNMAPSCQSMVPVGMNDGTMFPVMSAFALPSSLLPPNLIPADPVRVENMAAELRDLEFVPVNLADNIAEAIIVGIQSALAMGGRRRL